MEGADKCLSFCILIHASYKLVFKVLRDLLNILLYLWLFYTCKRIFGEFCGCVNEITNCYWITPYYIFGVLGWFYPGSKSLVQDCGLFGVLVCACRLDAEEKLEALLMVAME